MNILDLANVPFDSSPEDGSQESPMKSKQKCGKPLRVYEKRHGFSFTNVEPVTLFDPEVPWIQ